MATGVGQIVSVGARAPLGLSSLQVAMCVRARKLEPRSCHLTDKRDRPVGVCLTGGLGAQLYGLDRLIRLAAPALVEACDGQVSEPTPLVLALAEPGRPDDRGGLGEELIAGLADRAGVPLDVERSAVVRRGHAGAAHAFETAASLLDHGAPAVLVGGVDSYYHPEVLAWLDAAYRLKAIEAEDGITPSEGAAFCLLRRDAAGPDGAVGDGAPRAMAVVHSVATASERLDDDDEPNIGEAMTALLGEVAERRGPLPWVMTDLNGERHRLREWNLVALRGSLADPGKHDRLLEDLGDLGAATGVMLVAIACVQWQLGCAAAESLVVALSSEGPERGIIELGGGA